LCVFVRRFNQALSTITSLLPIAPACASGRGAHCYTAGHRPAGRNMVRWCGRALLVDVVGNDGITYAARLLDSMAWMCSSTFMARPVLAKRRGAGDRWTARRCF
jgi:hypothetical protein